MQCSVTQVSDSLCPPWNKALQAPLSMGFSRQDYCGRLPFPTPGDPTDPGIEHGSLLHWQAGSLALAPPGNPRSAQGKVEIKGGDIFRVKIWAVTWSKLQYVPQINLCSTVIHIKQAENLKWAGICGPSCFLSPTDEKPLFLQLSPGSSSSLDNTASLMLRGSQKEEVSASLDGILSSPLIPREIPTLKAFFFLNPRSGDDNNSNNNNDSNNKRMHIMPSSLSCVALSLSTVMLWLGKTGPLSCLVPPWASPQQGTPSSIYRNSRTHLSNNHQRRLKRRGFLLTDPGGAWRAWDHTVRSQGQGGMGRRNRAGVLPLWRRRVGCRGSHRYTPLVNLKHKSRNWSTGRETSVLQMAPYLSHPDLLKGELPGWGGPSPHPAV